MDAKSLEVWEKMIEGVERDESGKPILITRWGYKVETIRGKKYLVAASREELIGAFGEAKIEAQPSVCLGGQTGCINGTCQGKCALTYDNTGLWYCFCTPQNSSS